MRDRPRRTTGTQEALLEGLFEHHESMMDPDDRSVKQKSSRCNVFEKSGPILTNMNPVFIVEFMNTNNTGPDSGNDPSTQNPQGTQDNEEPHPQDAEEAPGGVNNNSEPVVDLPDQGNMELQDAMQKLVESAQYLLGYILEKRNQHSCDDRASEEEPANIAYGAAFYDENGQGCGSMGEYAPAEPGPFYNPFGEQAKSNQRDSAKRGFGLGMSMGAALTAAGVNALGQDMLWLLEQFATTMGSGLRSAFGSKRPPQVMRMARPMRSVFRWPGFPTSGDSDVTRMPTQESWGSFCRGSAPETSGPTAAAPGAIPDPNDFMKKVVDLREKVKAGTEQHEEIADVFKHFEELFGDFFPGFEKKL